MAGFLLIDKPKGITSHDVVDKLRKITDIKKIGHAGTLDPNATGLLVVGISREATKQLGEIAKGTKKIYKAEVYLGEERDSDDAEGKVTHSKEVKIPPDKFEVEEVLNSFLGTQKQDPPAFSAIKIGGKKSYDLARAGKSVKLKPRDIEIFKVDLIDYKFPKLEFRVEVSSGTYIRALARDIGRKLETYGFLKELRRESIGKFSLKKAVKLEQLNSDNWREHLVDLQ